MTGSAHGPSLASWIWTIPALPLAGFLLWIFLGGWLVRKLGDRAGRAVVGGVATALVLGALAVSVAVLLDLLRLEPEHRRYVASLLPIQRNVPWIHVGPVEVYYRALVDPLSVLMCLIVTGVGGLIHLYATGYMAHDRDYPRFFAYFNLFIFAMLVLVLGDSLLMMFVGWEGVGLCSYLLISFWYEDPANARAGTKAFVVNRVGDVGFALGIMATLAIFGTLVFYTPDGQGFLDMAIRKTTATGPLTAGVAALIGGLLFVGACGKSAQFPLHIWLPDAMAGPTPVSALIHAATMVTAGVVMLSRLSPLLVQSPDLLMVIALVGLFTALFAATIAFTQDDIKKVLAYSTVSQLGFMVLGCGAGAFAAGMFHVTTHAFFKALLFLGAGSVIHGLLGEQNMQRMGGLAKYMKTTYWTMLVGWAAISGLPGLSGYWSKDAILEYASGIPRIGLLAYVIGSVTAFLTGLYMTRLMAKTFWTQARFDAEKTHPHESPPSMTLPLVLLAILSLVGGLLGLPWANRIEAFLEPSLPPAALFATHGAVSVTVGLIVGGLVAVAAMAVGIVVYRRHLATGSVLSEAAKDRNVVYRAARHLWYVDAAANAVFVRGGGRFGTRLWKWVDAGIVDGTVNGIAFVVGLLSEIGRGIQSGYVRVYLTTMLGGLAFLLIWALTQAGGK